MKTIIAGTTVTLQSALKLDDIKKVGSYNPSALQLKDDKENVIFTLLAGGVGMVESDIVSFAATAPDGSGAAVVSITLPTVKEKSPKQAVAGVYGPTIAKAAQVETQIAQALEEVNAMLTNVEESIVVAGEESAEAVAADEEIAG